MYRAYESELYRFDQLYRHFCESADTAESAGWSILKPLRADIEAHYVNLYIDQPGAGLGQVHRTPRWVADEVANHKVTNQYRFYDRNVRPWLEEGDNRRAFVTDHACER